MKRVSLQHYQRPEPCRAKDCQDPATPGGLFCNRHWRQLVQKMQERLLEKGGRMS